MNRNGFLAASATVLAAGATAAQGLAQNVPGGTAFVENRANFDLLEFERIVGKPADIRQVFESVAFQPGLFNNVKNSLNGLQFGFGHSPERIAVAIAGHGPSAAYGFSDYVWQKYKIGDFINAKDASGATLTSNTFLKAKSNLNASDDPNDDKGFYQDTSIEALQKRGVIMLTCHTAVEEQARRLVKQGLAPSGMTPTEVANDILTHLIPGAVVVPSMVATVAVLQAKHNYTYAALTF